LPKQRDRVSAFTLTELLVSMGVLVLLVLLFTQLLNSSATIMTLGNKKMDADSEARQVLDRMAFDFAQMFKRPCKGSPCLSDVDYYLKSSSIVPASDCGVCGPQDGSEPGRPVHNDQAAFYSTVPGYYAIPTPTPAATPIPPSPVSLVSYRINSDSASAFYNKMQRMSKALAWNGVLPTSLTPVVFLPQTIGGPQPVGGTWPSATSTSLDDPSYEVIGPQVFRFEYYYLLTNQNFSDIPFWNTAAVNGMQDVAAIVVDIAVIDPKSKVLVSDAQLARLNGADGQGQGPVLIDWGNTSSPYCSPSCPNQQQWQRTPGLLLAQWRAALDANTIGLPPPVISGIRVYERYFYLTH
jgi:type II secretory pathway pseudopilin PulG